MPVSTNDIIAFVYQQPTAANGSGLDAEAAEAPCEAVVPMMQLHDDEA